MHSLVALNYLFLAERTKSLPAAMQSQLRLLSVMQAEQSRAEHHLGAVVGNLQTHAPCWAVKAQRRKCDNPKLFLMPNVEEEREFLPELCHSEAPHCTIFLLERVVFSWSRQKACFAVDKTNTSVLTACSCVVLHGPSLRTTYFRECP